MRDQVYVLRTTPPVSVLQLFRNVDRFFSYSGKTEKWQPSWILDPKDIRFAALQIRQTSFVPLTLYKMLYYDMAQPSPLWGKGLSTGPWLFFFFFFFCLPTSIGYRALVCSIAKVCQYWMPLKLNFKKCVILSCFLPAASTQWQKDDEICL